MKAYKSQRKGQTATEYLIILAVVIIIALIVVGVLGGIPGIGGSSRASATAAFWQTAEIGISAWAFAATGTDSIVIKNNRASSVVVNDIRIHPTLATVSTVAAASIFTTPGSANQTLAAGESLRYEGGGSSPSNLKSAWSNVSCSAGESYSYYVEIDWEDVPTGASYTFDGSDTTLDGTCAS